MHSVAALAIESAAAAISVKEYGMALEWLETGCSIVWNQMLQLRAQFECLSVVDPFLADRLKAAAQRLEVTGHRDTHAGKAKLEGIEAVAQRHRHLAEDYERMLGAARRLPGFEYFLRLKKVADITTVAQSGLVVVVNVHTSRYDALVLLTSSNDIAHIPLPDLSHEDIHHRLREH